MKKIAFLLSSQWHHVCFQLNLIAGFISVLVSACKSLDFQESKKVLECTGSYLNLSEGALISLIGAWIFHIHVLK